MLCPYVYMDGLKCLGEIKSITLVKATINVTLNEFGEVKGIKMKPKYANLSCAYAGQRIKYLVEHPELIRIPYEDLPEGIRNSIEGFSRGIDNASP